eukprot:6177256-Pleurochrysis_carterae.AAC.5
MHAVSLKRLSPFTTLLRRSNSGTPASTAHHARQEPLLCVKLAGGSLFGWKAVARGAGGMLSRGASFLMHPYTIGILRGPNDSDATNSRNAAEGYRRMERNVSEAFWGVVRKLCKRRGSVVNGRASAHEVEQIA